MKKELAQQYIELKKQFDGKEFKAGIKAHNADWLVKEFSVKDLKDKISAVRRALAMKNQQEWVRYYVVVELPNFKHKYSFSGIDKRQLFIDCVNFACGFVSGYIVNNESVEISTNAAQSIDGFIWWDTKNGKNVVYITDENGEIIKK